MTSKLKALGGCSSHHLQGAGHIVPATLQLVFCCTVHNGSQTVRLTLSLKQSFTLSFEPT